MLKFDRLNLSNNLPDTYRKDVDSNNYKILAIERDSVGKIDDTLAQITKILDIDTAEGAVLDLYGEEIGQVRGAATDAQYRIMLKAKATRNLSNGTYQSIVNAMAITFNCDKSEIKFEDAGTPCTVNVTVFPVSEINEAGFTTNQATAIIKSLLPVCVTLNPISVGGTFCFADGEGEYDNDAGFTDVEGGTTGGTLSEIYGVDNESILPI